MFFPFKYLDTALVSLASQLLPVRSPTLHCV